MDLQAILDSADSDSETSFSEGGIGKSYISSSPNRSNTSNAHSALSYNSYSHNHFGSGGGSESGVDLERILREDDDEDDHDVDDGDFSSSSGSGEGRYDVYDGRRSSKRGEDDPIPRPPTYSSSSRRISSITASYRDGKNNASSNMSTAEEWDVLQAILGEDDDDDYGEYTNEYHPPTSSYRQSYDDRRRSEFERDADEYSGSRSSGQQVSVLRTQNEVDLILQQSSDEEDDFGEEKDDEFSAALQRQQRKYKNYMYSTYNSKNNVSNDDDDLVDLGNTDSFMTAMQSHSHDSEMSTKKANSEERGMAGTSFISSTNTSSIYHTKHSIKKSDRSKTNDKDGPLIASSDVELEKASRKALQVARAKEAKLLKSTREARDNIVSPLTVKRRLKPKIELDTKSQRQAKQQNLTNQPSKSSRSASNITVQTNNNSSNPYFNFSGGSISMKQFQSVSRSLAEKCRSDKDHENLPTTVGINSRFVAIGTQSGAILVYDHFEVLRQILGGIKRKTSGDDDYTAAAVGGDASFNPKTAGAVTTIDMSLVQGEFLAAGYAGGNVVLWDIIRGIPLKSVIDTNGGPYPSPIVSVRFFSADLKLVTADASGLVNKLWFSKNMLWSTYGVESECLLDGTAGQILAVNTLPPYQYIKQQLTLQQQKEKSNGNAAKTLRSTMKKLSLLALSNERNSFAIAVEPTVSVLHRWQKPDQQRIEGKNSKDDQMFLPCLSWGWALVNGGGNVINPILARAWGCCIQFLRASFPDLEDGNGVVENEGFQFPAFGVHDEYDVEFPVVALEWLNDRSMVYLSMNNEFMVIDTVMMTLLERLDFSNLKLVYAEFSLSRKVAVKKEEKFEDSGGDNIDPIATGGEEDKKEDDKPALKAETFFCTTFQNSIRSCDKRLLLLCQKELNSVSVVGARPRISSLENDGEWLEALALALDHYENTIKSQEDRKRSSVKDLSKHPGLQSRNGDGRTEDEEWIAKLLIRYLNIAVENAPETSNNFNFPAEIRQSQMDLAKSHFQMLAGVCVEFCTVTKRLDLLYGPIFRRFHAAGFLSVFLDVLEPYILNDKLNYIAPEAMMHFVEHCRTNNGIATVERCLLHMDVTIMDFDTILNLLRANEMYSALFYIYNQGLNDYTTPLEILCDSIFDAADTLGQLTNERRVDGVAQNDFERFGYKAILYLQSTFKGRNFPKGTEMEENLLQKVRLQLLRFLLQSRYTPSRSIRAPSEIIGQRALRYPYAHILLMVDPKAMFDTISAAMDAPDEEFRSSGSTGIRSIHGWEDGSQSGGGNAAIPDRQEVITMLLSIMMPSKDDVAITHQSTLYQSKSAVNAFLDFLADYSMRGVIRTDKSVTFMILNRMASRFSQARESEDRKKSQGQIIALLSALPRSSYDSEAVLQLVEKSGIHRASLLLHQAEASAWPQGNTSMEQRAIHFCAAIDCYLDDDDIDFRKEVFSYVKKECSGASDEHKEPNTLRDALITKLIDLVLLDPLLTAELAADLFVDDPDLVIRSLDDEEAKFMFLKAVISGELNEMDSVAGSVLNAQLNTEHHQQYMGLMAKLHPDMVYDYLSTHNNYRTEECLQLCQRYDIADASAYLLERMGNVTSALQLILQTMETRMMNLKRTIRGMSTDRFEKYYPRLSRHNRVYKRDPINPELYGKQEKEIEGLKKILTVALDVCQRNSGSFSTRTETEHGSQLWFNVLDRLINAKGFLRLSKEQPTHAKVMSGVLSELLRLTMQRMVSSVPLPDLVRKVTSDHSGSRLGEVREMIESLLITYGQELDVFGGAINVFKYDSHQMEKVHHGLRVRGSNIQTVMGVPVKKGSSAMHKCKKEKEILKIGGATYITRRDANRSSSNSDFRSSSGGTDKQQLGLGDALSRLRSRGKIDNQSTGAGRMQKASGLNLMTSNEMAYRRGELSDDATYFEDRLIGQLGDAEHRGRIMSFIY